MKEEIVVLVRAIPEESRKYQNLVCTAGVNNEGKWIRLYPIQFVHGKIPIAFSKNDVIEVEVSKPQNDKRMESRRLIRFLATKKKIDYPEALKIIRPLLSSIKQLKEHKASLGVIKPEILDIKINVQNTKIYDEQTYFNLWSENYLEQKEKVKLPVEVRYIFKCKNIDCNCNKRPHKQKLIDWELNELARNIMRKDKNKDIIKEKIRQRLFNWMKARDVYFFVGTHFKYNTWMIIGIYYPSQEDAEKTSLLDFS